MVCAEFRDSRRNSILQTASDLAILLQLFRDIV